MLNIFKAKIIISDIKGLRKNLKKHFYVNFLTTPYIPVSIQTFPKDYGSFDTDSDHPRMYCSLRLCPHTNVGIQAKAQ